jgi:hypothetical protein
MRAFGNVTSDTVVFIHNALLLQILCAKFIQIIRIVLTFMRFAVKIVKKAIIWRHYESSFT